MVCPIAKDRELFIYLSPDFVRDICMLLMYLLSTTPPSVYLSITALNTQQFIEKGDGQIMPSYGGQEVPFIFKIDK